MKTNKVNITLEYQNSKIFVIHIYMLVVVKKNYFDKRFFLSL